LTSDINSSGLFTSAATAPSADGDLVVNIPAGVTGLTSFGAPITEITVSQITNNPPAPPTGDGAVGLYYDIEPTGSTFSSPITMTFKYDPSLLPAGATPYAAWYNPATQQWEQLTTVSIDTVNHTITASVNHFSTFAVLTSNSGITINAPSDIVLGANGVLTVGETANGSSTGSVEAVGSWEVYAQDSTDTGSNSGHMTTDPTGQGTAGSYTALQYPLCFGDEPNPTSPENGIFTYSGSGNSTLPFYAAQVVSSGDSPGKYYIVITFTGSIK
jgi:hypothetical protein